MTRDPIARFKKMDLVTAALFFCGLLGMIGSFFLKRDDGNRLLRNLPNAWRPMLHEGRHHPGPGVQSNATESNATRPHFPGKEAPVTAEEKCLQDLEMHFNYENLWDRHRARLDQIFGEWVFDEAAEVYGAPTAPGQFFLALARAGLLEGRKTALDEDEALRLLTDLQVADPLNSAPFLFAALIEERNGQLRKAQDILARARNTRYFDNFMPTLARTLLAEGKDPVDFLFLFGRYAAAPIPDLPKLKEFLKNKDFEYFAEQMIQPGLDPSHLLPDSEWDVLQYAIGRSLLLKKEKFKNLPTFNGLTQLKRKNKAVDEYYDFDPESICQPEKLNPKIEFLQRRIGGWKTRY